MTERAMDRVVQAIEARGGVVKTNGPNKAKAQCPAHHDNDPSLSLTQIEGSVLMKCWSGECSNKEILAAVGLTMADLYDAREQKYRYDDGRTAHRYYNKEKPDKKQFTQYGHGKKTPQLFRASKVTGSTGVTIFLVEGEKDVLALESLDLTATTAPMGADNFHLVDATPLKDKTVAAIVDQDEDRQGDRWARKVQSKLHGVARSVKFYAPRAGKDAADHVAAGYGAADLVDYDPFRSVPEVMRDVNDDILHQLDEPSYIDDIPDSWAPIDLGPYLRGEVVRPTPTVGIARADGLRMLYPGKEHAVIGEMESGKSWFAIASAAAEMNAGNTVDYLHFEESDPSDTIERLQALGVRPVVIEKLFRFVAPQRKVSVDALRSLLDPAPTLVILDGVNEAMSLHGWGIREEDGAAQFRRHLVMPCTRVGAAVLSCDHVVKDVERRGRNAIGSIHKGNGLSGSLILLETAEPFGRGMKGRSHVYITKDRPGHLRSHGKPDKKMPGKTFMGSLVVDDEQVFTPDLALKFWAPNAEPLEEEMPPAVHVVDDHVVATVQSIVSKGAAANTRAVRAMAGLRVTEVDGALERLVIGGRLEKKEGKRGAHLYTVSGDQLSESAL